MSDFRVICKLLGSDVFQMDMLGFDELSKAVEYFKLCLGFEDMPADAFSSFHVYELEYGVLFGETFNSCDDKEHALEVAEGSSGEFLVRGWLDGSSAKGPELITNF